MGYGTQGFRRRAPCARRRPEPALAHFRSMPHVSWRRCAAPTPMRRPRRHRSCGLVANPLRQRTVDPLASQFHNRTAVSHQKYRRSSARRIARTTHHRPDQPRSACRPLRRPSHRHTLCRSGGLAGRPMDDPPHPAGAMRTPDTHRHRRDPPAPAQSATCSARSAEPGGSHVTMFRVAGSRRPVRQPASHMFHERRGTLLR